MFQTIFIVSVLYTGIQQQAGGYPIPSSVVELPNVLESSYINVSKSTDVANKALMTTEEKFLNKYSTPPTKTADAITFRDVQKSTVSSAFNLDLKISKYWPPSSMTTVFITNGKNHASARLMMADWRNRQHSLDDGESVTHPLPETTAETTTETTIKSTDLLTTTEVMIDNSTTTVDDTVSTVARTRRVPRTHYGEANDKRWFSIEVVTKADRLSSSPDSTRNLECPCQVNKLHPDIRFSNEHGKEMGEKPGDVTDWRNI